MAGEMGELHLHKMGRNVALWIVAWQVFLNIENWLSGGKILIDLVRGE